MNTKMKWELLVNDKRFGLEDYHDPKRMPLAPISGAITTVLFFHRLSGDYKTRRRYSLPGSIFVHNRLTHSMEVACVGKSMADNIAVALRDKYRSMGEATEHFDHLGDIVAAACLAHDLGNPPFGHSGSVRSAPSSARAQGATSGHSLRIANGPI